MNIIGGSDKMLIEGYVKKFLFQMKVNNLRQIYDDQHDHGVISDAVYKEKIENLEVACNKG